MWRGRLGHPPWGMLMSNLQQICNLGSTAVPAISLLHLALLEFLTSCLEIRAAPATFFSSAQTHSASQIWKSQYQVVGCASPGLDSLMLWRHFSILQEEKPPLDLQPLSEKSHHVLTEHASGSHLCGCLLPG